MKKYKIILVKEDKNSITMLKKKYNKKHNNSSLEMAVVILTFFQNLTYLFNYQQLTYLKK